MHLHSHGGHRHGHPHGGHQHGGHDHGLGGASTGILGASVVATFVLVFAEFTAGYAGHSIALISDAIHNLTDVPTLVISWLAMRWALRPPTPEKTYGYHRAGILAAFVNAMLLAFAALFLIYESIGRLRRPVEIHTSLMMWISVLALAINGGITLAVHRGRKDLNVRAVWIHNLGDALSNVAIFVGALAIHATGRYGSIRSSASRSARWSCGPGWGSSTKAATSCWKACRGAFAWRTSPRRFCGYDGIQEVHDIHIWTLGTDLHALSCHVRIPDMHMEDCEKILESIKEVLAHDFHITHTTVQFERAGLPAEAGLYMPEPVRRSV